MSLQGVNWTKNRKITGVCVTNFNIHLIEELESLSLFLIENVGPPTI
jgi:hypothetical protein